MKSHILFLDLDGTLLNDRKEITPGNRLALEGALARGHRVVITTGRPLKSARIQAQRLGLTGRGCYLIACNGAIVYDCWAERELFHLPLDLEALWAVFDEANRRGVCILTYDREDVLVEARNDNENVRRYCAPIQMDYRVIGDVRRDLPEPPVKALLLDFHDRGPVEGMERWIRDNLRGKADCFFSSQYYLEVVPVGMSKGRAVEEMCRWLGVPVANAIAVGDAANDLSMIQAAGIGVAMANGMPAVRAAADYVTQRDNNHDGIAEVVERFCE